MNNKLYQYKVTMHVVCDMPYEEMERHLDKEVSIPFADLQYDLVGGEEVKED